MSQLKILLTGLFFVLLQITLLNLMSIRGIRPDLIILFVVGRSLAEGPTAGVIWGFGLGLLLDAIGSGPIGLGALAYSVSGFFCGLIGPGKAISPARYLWVLALGSVITFAIFYYFREPWNIVGWTEPIWARILPGTIYSWCLGLIWVLSPFSRFKAEKSRG
jgi:rod shape-determining protein MreD